MKKIPIKVLDFATQKMWDALNVMPKSEAAVARFFYLFLFTLKDISEKSRRSENWVHQKLNKARRRLKLAVGPAIIDYFEAHRKIVMIILSEVEKEIKEGRYTLKRLR